MLIKADSIGVLERYELSWKLHGIGTKYNKTLCGFYDMLITVFLTVGFPLHLLGGLAQSKDMEEIIRNLVINVCSLACTVKYFNYLFKFKAMQHIKEVFRSLDQRMEHPEESSYFYKEVMLHTNRILIFFFVLYGSVGVLSPFIIIMADERTLLYPGWFPFDWYDGPVSWYIIGVVYQILGLQVEIIQNFANDVYVPLTLCLISGHVRTLTMRVARIAHDLEKTAEQHNQELIGCIEDYTSIMKLLTTIQQTLSLSLFTQFVSGGFNICVSLFYILFFANSFYTYAYYTLQLLAFVLELFPCCYYGTVIEMEFNNLPYAIFSCNWLGQTKEFHRNLILFTELSLQEVTAYAAGIVQIHVGAFLSSMKLAYSFFCFIINMR